MDHTLIRCIACANPLIDFKSTPLSDSLDQLSQLPMAVQYLSKELYANITPPTEREVLETIEGPPAWKNSPFIGDLSLAVIRTLTRSGIC